MMKRTPLVMMPDGSFIRSADVPEGGIIVTEPELPEEPEYKVFDQTAAVLEAQRGSDSE